MRLLFELKKYIFAARAGAPHLKCGRLVLLRAVGGARRRRRR